MTQEELLKPRWEVIATYPDSDFELGSIEDRDWAKYVNGEDESDGVEWRISDFPHLFRKLEWWEKRDIKDMPEYLEEISSGMVFKMYGTWNLDDSIIKKYIPATLEEYTNYILKVKYKLWTHK